MDARADRLHLAPREETGVDLEAQYIPVAAIFGVPIARALRGVFPVQHRIEKRWSGKRVGKAFQPLMRINSSSFSPVGRNNVNAYSTGFPIG